MGGACNMNGEKRKAYEYMLLVGTPEGKRPRGKERRRWVDKIRMDLLEIGWGGVDCVDLAQDSHNWRAVVNVVMSLQVS
jgi:hypothetical protein